MNNGDRQPHPLARLATAVAIALLLMLIAWLISTPAQRAGYLRTLGLLPPPEQARPVRQETRTVRPPIETYRLPAVPRTSALVTPIRPRPHGIGSACRPETAANPSRAEESTIYRWTDAAGQVHFSDRPTSDAAVEAVGTSHRRGTENYSLSYRFMGLDGSANLQNAIEAEMRTVFRFLEDQLSVGDLPAMHANLVIIGSKSDFVSYREHHAPALTTHSGYYDFGSNEAVVYWKSDSSGLPVARHEMAHLAMGNAFGELPDWFSEGLAEVVERLSASGSAITAGIDEVSLRRLRERDAAGGLPDLQWLMRSSRADWEQAGGEPFIYGLSWALLHFMLSHDDTRGILQAYFRHLAAHKCRPVDTPAFFDLYYPGGIAAMDGDFRRWLRQGAVRPLYF